MYNNLTIYSCHTINVITKVLNCGHKHMLFIILGVILCILKYFSIYPLPETLFVINGLNNILFFFLQVIYKDLTLEEKCFTDSYTDKFQAKYCGCVSRSL